MTTSHRADLQAELILATTKTSTIQLLLLFQKNNSSYLLASRNISNGKILSHNTYASLSQAMDAYINTACDLHELKGMESKTEINQSSLSSQEQLSATGAHSCHTCSANHKSPNQGNPCHVHETGNDSLHPSDFYTPHKAPEWLIARKSFLDLNSGVFINKDEHYKLLTTDIKAKLSSQKSIVHLQDRHGKNFMLTLDQICGCFLTAERQNWKHK